MNEGTSQLGSSEPSKDKYGLLSSIAAVREILLNSAVTESDVVEELTKQKQESYKEKLHLQEELQKQRTLLKDLNSKTEHAKEEAQREKSMRLLLEEAYSKLEDHRKEIVSQLQTTKSSQAEMEENIARFREELDEQNTEFEKERAKWAELVQEMRAKDESSKQEIGRLEARLASSQQELKDVETEIENLKKQLEDANRLHEEMVQGDKELIERLNKRVKQGQVATIEDLHKRLAEAESNYETTLEKLRNAREDLLSFRQFSDKRQDMVLSKKANEKVRDELESTEAALKEAEKELESKKEAVARLTMDDSEKTGDALSQHTSELAKAKLDAKKATLKLRQVLKKLDGLYKRRLELVKSEVKGTKEDLDTVMERLRLVSADATKAQADYADFQSRKAVLLEDKDAASKKRTVENDEAEKTLVDKRQRQS